MSDRFAAVDEVEVVHRGWELTVQIEGPSRQAEDVLQLIAEANIKVLAHCCYSHCSGARLLVVPEDVEAACIVVRAAGYESELNPIVWVTTPYRVGMTTLLGVQLQTGGVDILYRYVAWKDGQRAVYVLKTTHDDLAFQILRLALEGRAFLRR